MVLIIAHLQRHPSLYLPISLIFNVFSKYFKLWLIFKAVLNNFHSNDILDKRKTGNTVKNHSNFNRQSKDELRTNFLSHAFPKREGRYIIHFSKFCFSKVSRRGPKTWDDFPSFGGLPYLFRILNARRQKDTKQTQIYL